MAALRSDERGQSLVLIVLAMGVVLAMASFAIDLASWYQKHHQAQVAADAAALAAANYMSSGGTAATATTKAVSYASSNGIAISSSDVTVDTTSSSVSVTVPTSGTPLFAHVFHFGNVAISARAQATWTNSSIDYSLFAANSHCGSGLGLQLLSQGGGDNNLTGLFSNGEFIVNAHSNHTIDGAFEHDQPGSPGYCSDNSTTVKDGTISNAGTTAIPYPETFAQPTGSACDHSAPYFTTDAGKKKNPTPSADLISGPGVYCISQPLTDPSGCADALANTAQNGWIYVDGSSLTNGSYEFVGPCVSFTNPPAWITAPAGQPLIYGTSNFADPASTPSGFPSCTNSTTSATSTYVDGNGATLASPVYDQCGTVEIKGNNPFLGFIEAYNIVLDKNNGVSGNGPTPPYGGPSDHLTQ